jgi:hypothetical protein
LATHLSGGRSSTDLPGAGAKLCHSRQPAKLPRSRIDELPQRFSQEQMIDLEPVKKCLRVSPTLYRNVYKLYRATPFGRTRAAQIHQESTELLHMRLESEARLIREYLNDDWTVRHGPFTGMRYAAMSSGSLLSPKVIGSYESPIHSWIMDAIKHDYDNILNVGCGEGYYAVGFSLKSPSQVLFGT